MDLKPHPRRSGRTLVTLESAAERKAFMQHAFLTTPIGGSDYPINTDFTNRKLWRIGYDEAIVAQEKRAVIEEVMGGTGIAGASLNELRERVALAERLSTQLHGYLAPLLGFTPAESVGSSEPA